MKAGMMTEPENPVASASDRVLGVWRVDDFYCVLVDTVARGHDSNRNQPWCSAEPQRGPSATRTRTRTLVQVRFPPRVCAPIRRHFERPQPDQNQGPPV